MICLSNRGCEKHLADVLAWSIDQGLFPTLVERLHYLNTYACEREITETRCYLFPDSEPHSFTFTMERVNANGEGYDYWFNGGLIFNQGRGEWGVHT